MPINDILVQYRHLAQASLLLSDCHVSCGRTYASIEFREASFGTICALFRLLSFLKPILAIRSFIFLFVLVFLEEVFTKNAQIENFVDFQSKFDWFWRWTVFF